MIKLAAEIIFQLSKSPERGKGWKLLEKNRTKPWNPPGSPEQWRQPSGHNYLHMDLQHDSKIL
jgi:hypothetical protein